MMMMANHIADERRLVSVFLLTVLQSILNEQHKARALDKETADYVYAAVKDQAIKQGWIDEEDNNESKDSRVRRSSKEK